MTSLAELNTLAVLWIVLQDYAEFFDALEHEELYDCLGLDVPEVEEVEFSKKYQPEEKVYVHVHVYVRSYYSSMYMLYCACKEVVEEICATEEALVSESAVKTESEVPKEEGGSDEV